MHAKALIRALVGIEKIITEIVFMEAVTNAIVINSRLLKRDLCRCGLCHKKSSKYDNGQGLRRWRCLDVGLAKIFLEAKSPWFCKNFEEQVAWLCVHSSKTLVAELMRIEWHTVGELCARV